MIVCVCVKCGVCVCVPMFVCVSVDTEELSAHGKHCMPETHNEVHAKTKQEQVYKYSNRNDIISKNGTADIVMCSWFTMSLYWCHTHISLPSQEETSNNPLQSSRAYSSILTLGEQFCAFKVCRCIL